MWVERRLLLVSAPPTVSLQRYKTKGTHDRRPVLSGPLQQTRRVTAVGSSQCPFRERWRQSTAPVVGRASSFSSYAALVLASLLARMSAGHPATRMTWHARIWTGAAVLAGWDLD